MRAVGEAAAEQAAAAAEGHAAAPDDPERPPPADALLGEGGAGSGSSGSLVGSGSSGILGWRRQDPRLQGLPPPMIPGNEEVTTVSCFIQASRLEGVFGRAAGCMHNQHCSLLLCAGRPPVRPPPARLHAPLRPHAAKLRGGGAQQQRLVRVAP